MFLVKTYLKIVIHKETYQEKIESRMNVKGLK